MLRSSYSKRYCAY